MGGISRSPSDDDIFLIDGWYLVVALSSGSRPLEPCDGPVHAVAVFLANG